MQNKIFSIMILFSFVLSIQVSGLVAKQEKPPDPIAQKNDNQIVRSYVFGNYEIARSTDEYKLPWIKVTGLGMARIKNNFIIPQKIELIAVPPDAQVYFRIIEKSCNSIPNQEIVSKLQIKEDSIPFNGFPSEVTHLGAKGSLRYQSYQELVINPMIYNNGNIQYCSKIKIEMNWSGGWTGYQKVTINEPLFEDVYKNAVVNYEQGLRYRAKKIMNSIPETPLFRVVNPFKMKVNENGIYRLTYNDLINAKIPVNRFDPRKIQIFNKGKEIAIYIRGEEDGKFDPSDYLEFYGEKMTPNPANSLEFEGGDYTDENVYWLYIGRLSGKRVTSRDVAPEHNYSAAPNYRHTEEFHPWGFFYYQVWSQGMHHWVWAHEVKAVNPIQYCCGNSVCPQSQETPTHCPTYCPDGDCGNGCSSNPPTTEGWKGFPVHLPEIDHNSSRQSHMVVKLMPRSYSNCPPEFPYDHHSIIQIGSFSNPEYWCSYDATNYIVDHYQEFDIDNNYLSENTDVKLRLPGDIVINPDQCCQDRIALESINVTYDRLFNAVNDAIDFDYQNGNWRFIVNEFSDQYLSGYDITFPQNPVMLTNYVVSPGSNNTFNLTLEDSNPANSHYVFVTDGVTKKPVSIAQDVPSYWKTPYHNSDYLIITDKSFINTDPLNRLVQLKQGKGFKVAVVDIEDIYDEFNYGIFDPKAIKTFLEYVFYFWHEPVPQFVLFVGDPTFDYKHKRCTDDQPFNWFLYTPTMIGSDIYSPAGLYSSDSYLASVTAEDPDKPLPDFFVGRLSIHKIEGNDPYYYLDSVVNKIMQYESLSPTEAWSKKITMVADCPADEYEQVIECAHNIAKDRYLPTPPYEVNKLYFNRYYVEFPPPAHFDVARMKSDITQAINNGTIIFTYAGHGVPMSWGRWCGTFWSSSGTNNDISNLANYNKYPLMINTSCYTGSIFRDASPTTAFSDVMMETAVNARNKGAIAAIASSAFDDVYGVSVGIPALYDDIFAPDKKDPIIGSIFYRTLSAYYDNGLQAQGIGIMLLGDPSIHLITPVVQKPANLVAVPGNQKITLSWTPPQGTILGINIYRCLDDPYQECYPLCCDAPVYTDYPPDPDMPCDSFLSNYQIINSQLVKSNSYEDSGLTNNFIYYYHVVAKNVNGFDSQWSNEAIATPSGPIPLPKPKEPPQKDK